MKKNLFAALVAGCAFLALAQPEVTVTEPWVRGTVSGQKASGAFMGLKSSSDVRLVGASSPAAKVVEIHEMSTSDGVMRMRAIEGMPLPAGKSVELKPGGYHVMLMDLKQQLKPGDKVPVTLTTEGADKKRQTTQVTAEVRELTAGPQGGGSHHKH